MHQLDARRLLCPLPVIRVQDYIAKLQPGERLEVFCTDPGVVHDIPAWCRVHGHLVLTQSCRDDEYRFELEVAGESDEPA